MIACELMNCFHTHDFEFREQPVIEVEVYVITEEVRYVAPGKTQNKFSCSALDNWLLRSGISPFAGLSMNRIGMYTDFN